MSPTIQSPLSINGTHSTIKGNWDIEITKIPPK